MPALALPAARVVREEKGGTVRLSYARPDGGREHLLVRTGATRVTALYAHEGLCGRLLHATGRSWPAAAAAPALGARIRRVLT